MKRWWEWSPFTYPFNLTQQPAAAVPCGFTTCGLPVSMQIVGAKFSDPQVLRAAYAYETAHPFPVPSLDKYFQVSVRTPRASRSPTALACRTEIGTQREPTRLAWVRHDNRPRLSRQHRTMRHGFDPSREARTGGARSGQTDPGRGRVTHSANRTG
jgi:hypothetical protein